MVKKLTTSWCVFFFFVTSSQVRDTLVRGFVFLLIAKLWHDHSKKFPGAHRASVKKLLHEKMFGSKW